VDFRLADVLAGRRQAQEGAVVGAMVPLPDRHAIAGGEDVLDVMSVVRERPKEHAHDRFDALGPILHAGRRGVVFEVRRHQSVGQIQVLSVEDLVVEPPNDCAR
jgi:hypothetical protein